MYQNFKIVCVTPAGRRRYLKLLASYILSSDIVDRWDIWVNTIDENDIQFFEDLSRNFEKVKRVRNPEGEVNGNDSISWFYSTAVEKDTIYIKFDDDIVWVEDGFFEALLDYRIENRDYFLVFPAIVNNAVCTHLFQQKKKLKCSRYIQASCFDDLGWFSSDFASELHDWFLNHIESGSVDEIKFEPALIALNRISINCLSWFGEDFSEFDGIVLGEDEEYLTVIKPGELRKINAVFGGTLVSHFAFYTQRERLDSGNLLEEYESVLQKSENKSIAGIYEIVNALSAKHPVRKNVNESGVVEKCKRVIGHIKLPCLKWVSIGEIYRQIKLIFKKEETKYIIN